METENFTKKTKRIFFKITKRILITLSLLLVLIFAFFYWGEYENGLMAGKVLRISEKGILFKTHEGKLNLETFGALKGTSPIAESFEEEVIKQLQEVSLSGERVNLYFTKRYMVFPWHGESKYFVVRVERAKK
jgi:hypothetical protein